MPKTATLTEVGLDQPHNTPRVSFYIAQQQPGESLPWDERLMQSVSFTVTCPDYTFTVSSSKPVTNAAVKSYLLGEYNAAKAAAGY